MTEKVIIEFVEGWEDDRRYVPCCLCGGCAGSLVMAGIEREDGYHDPVCGECLKDRQNIDARVRKHAAEMRKEAARTMEKAARIESWSWGGRLVLPSYEHWVAANEAAHKKAANDYAWSDWKYDEDFFIDIDASDDEALAWFWSDWKYHEDSLIAADDPDAPVVEFEIPAMKS
jgi:hypothetical protein